MLLSIGIFSFSETSATRSSSDLPPPLVRRMKGMRCCWRYERASRAAGMGVEERSKTPSMLGMVVSFFV
jgi:hypothetical protein